MAEPERGEIEGLHIRLDRAHRIVRPDVILDPRRQEACLLPALTGLERAIYHAANRTQPSPRRPSEILAQPRSETHQFSRDLRFTKILRGVHIFSRATA